MIETMELLAPCGSMESLYGAVACGADALYLAGQTFGARNSAKNFTNEELISAINYAHLQGVRVYITVNTLITQREISEVMEFIDFLYNAGADALIVQDIGIASLLRKHYSNFPIHASTQMTIHNPSAVKFLKGMGFSRVVLARELSAARIENIKNTVDMELEIFIHGALCVCYSGQCYMSSLIGRRSGNRGKCAQPCRLPYSLINEKGSVIKEAYLLSPKDLSLIEELDKLEHVGADSLKIEGRLRKPEYVATVVSIFRKYINLLPKNSSTPTNADIKQLYDAFNRSGFTSGYFNEKLGSSIMSYDNPSNAANEVFSQDILAAINPNSGKKRSIYGQFCAIIAHKMTLSLYDEQGICVNVCSDNIVEENENSTVNIDRITAQLKKMGNTPFSLQQISIDCSENINLPVSSINALRRLACQQLEDAILDVYKRGNTTLPFVKNSSINKERNTSLTVEINTLNHLEALKQTGADTFAMIFASVDVFLQAQELFGTQKVILKTDTIIQDEDKLLFCEDILTANLGVLNKNKENSNKIFGDFRFNVTNSYSVDFFAENSCSSVCLSIELNLKAIAAITENTSTACEVIAYGKLPLMIMENCPIKAITGSCQANCESYKLKDRKNQEFSMICENKRCILINPQPLFMADKFYDITSSNVDFARLIFTDEDTFLTKKVMQAYKNAIAGKHCDNVFKEGEFTRGHFYRGML